MTNIDFEIIGGPTPKGVGPVNLKRLTVPHDTVYLLCPMNDGAKEYLHDIVPPEAPWLGDSVGVEHRFIKDLVAALIDDSFNITLNGDLIVGRNEHAQT